MKIKSLQLKNFKRFTDLTLQDIPENAKLVLLIGSNGSGKSSVFDAFEVLNRYRFNQHTDEQDPYYAKQNKRFQIILDFGNGFLVDTKIKVQKGEHKIVLMSYYGRTSFRQVPRLTRIQLGSTFDINYDNDRPNYFIDRDERFENDLEHLFGKLLKEFFKSDQDKSEIKNNVITPINKAFDRIFSLNASPKLELLELIPPLEGKIAEINFRKGGSIFHYNQLSAGEKEIFNILINLIARKEYYSRGILYFDEIDLHLNTKLQLSFLKEITENWIPEQCQLWTASHSLGFIEYAKRSEHSIIFDLDDYNFDFPRTITPSAKDNNEVYEIAVGKDILPNLFRDYQIIFAENKDTETYYSNLDLDHCILVKEADKKSVFNKARVSQYLGLIDRDFLSDEDVNLLENYYPNIRILRLYSVENYLYHPQNILEYAMKHGIQFNLEEYKKRIYDEKNKIKEELKIKIVSDRSSYSFFREVDVKDKKLSYRFAPQKENQDQSLVIAKELESNDFDTFYKHIPMKSYLTQISIRNSLPKIELSKTNWFKEQIASIINKKG